MTRSSVGDERRARGSERARLLDADDVEIASGREGGDGGDDGTTRASRGRVAIVGALGALALVSLGVSAASASGGVASATSALGDAYRAPWEREAWLGGNGNATASALGAHARGKLHVPIYIMGDGKKGSEDATKITKAYLWLSGLLSSQLSMSGKEIGSIVNFQQATFPSRWPATQDVAKDATSHIPHDKLAKIPFIQGVVGKDAEDCGRPCNSQLAHHTGCLLTHMRVWKRFLASKEPTFVMWESDGATLTGVHPLDYNELEAQLPEGADLVWLKPDEAPTGQLLKRFKSAATGLWSGLQQNQRFDNERDVYLYKFDKRCNWAGTPSYMMTRKGVQTIMKFIEEAEMADMIDAWLSKHCISHCDDPKVCMNLNCYFATVQKVQKEKQGGYVPSWYDEDDDERVREVDARIVKAMNDASKYNVLGCRHGNYNGFVPTSFRGTWGITDENSVADCYHTPQDGTYDFCDPKLHLPIGKSRAESTLGGGEKDGGVRETIMGWYERGFKMRMALLNRPVN